jgi:hypothetical protein
MTSNILLAVFAVTIILNAFALFRHWQAMRAFNILMSKLETAQRDFNTLVKHHQQTPRA